MSDAQLSYKCKQRCSRGTFMYSSKKKIVYHHDSSNSKLIDSSSAASLSEVQIRMMRLLENISNKIYSVLAAFKFLFKVIGEQSSQHGTVVV